MEPLFRPAGQDDVEMLLEFMQELYTLDGYPFIAGKARAALVGLLNNSELGRVWIIEVEGEAVGYVVLAFGYSLEFHGRDAFIDELFIKASHRRRGIGSRTLQFCVEVCPGLGVHALHLEVERHNTAAQAAYRRAGFEDQDRYLLTKWISSEDDEDRTNLRH
jgi:ribosomal protein S18 acetylase RimI-like enzyme